MYKEFDSISILHVDDDADFAEITAEILQQQDERFTIAHASSIEEAFTRLSKDDFDCIVSDYEMPGRNGIEFLEVVRDRHNDIPFILFTGKGSEEVAIEAIRRVARITSNRKSVQISSQY